MMAPVWIFLVPLVVLGGFAAVVGLGVYAVAKNRPGIIAGIGGLMLVLVAGGLLFALVGVRSVARVPETQWQAGPVSMTFNGGSNLPEMSSSVRVSWMGMLFVLALPLVLLFVLVRWMTSNKPGGECDRSVWVPAIVALALIGFIGLAGAKWHYARHYSNIEHDRRNAEVSHQIAEMHAEVAGQKAQVARQAVQAQAEIHIQQRIAQADIHKLMDEIDAPRIPLSPNPPAPSQASAVMQMVAETTETPAAIETSEAKPEEEQQPEETDAELAAEAAAAVESIDDEMETTVAKEARPETDEAEDKAPDGEAPDGEAADGEASSTVGEPTDSDKPAMQTETTGDEWANKEPADIEEAAEQPVAATAATAASNDDAPETAPVKPAPPAEEADLATAPEPVRVPSKPRPAWVNDRPQRVGETVREVIVTDEYASVDECTRATDIYLLFKTYERMHELVGRPSYETTLPSVTFSHGTVWTGDGRQLLYTDSDGKMTWDWSNEQIGFLHRLGIGVDYVRREIVAKDDWGKGWEPRQYFETVERTFGPMNKLYTQIEFTPAVDRELRQRWEAHQRTERFQVVGLGAGGVLGLLGMVFGLLKVDTWTKGYYTKRLFLGVPLALVGGFGLLVLFMETIGGH